MRLASVLVLTAVAAAPSAAHGQSAPSTDRQTAHEQQAVGVRHLVHPLRDGTTVED